MVILILGLLRFFQVLNFSFLWVIMVLMLLQSGLLKLIILWCCGVGVIVSCVLILLVCMFSIVLFQVVLIYLILVLRQCVRLWLKLVQKFFYFCVIRFLLKQGMVLLMVFKCSLLVCLMCVMVDLIFCVKIFGRVSMVVLVSVEWRKCLCEMFMWVFWQGGLWFVFVGFYLKNDCGIKCIVGGFDLVIFMLFICMVD